MMLSLSLPSRRGVLTGPELLNNGGFATDTIWTKGVGWTISGGNAVATTPGATSSLSQPVTFVSGQIYMATVVITSLTAGAILLRAYTATTPQNIGPTITTAGTYTRYVAVGSPDSFAIDASSAAVATIDSVSLKRVYL